MTIDDLPILGICGWSGSGKTTLIERIVPKLTAKGLKVAVVKHDAHGIDVDRPGKDSDRLYRAGADVLLQGPGEELLRLHGTEESDWTATLMSLAGRYDLVLVEGHKSTALRKVWLLGDDEEGPPAEAEQVVAVIPRGPDRLASVSRLLENFLSEQWLKTPIFGCVLIGGKSTRMGTPKHLLSEGGKTWVERTVDLLTQTVETVVIAGAGSIPPPLDGHTRLPDVPDAEGPMSGILAAMRWAPQVSWVVAACDLPDLSADAVNWLLSTRAPGNWATLPRLRGSDRAEPLLAHYDFRCGEILQRKAAGRDYRLADIASHPKVISPEVPAHLGGAWKNANSPTDLKSGSCTKRL